MLTGKGKGFSFPPLQKRIILHMAQSKPQTINETKKGILGHYKSSWIAFGVLEEKGLIKNVTSKEYRGRQYPCYWLTDRGINLALILGAKPQTLLRRTIEIYPQDRNSQFIIETASVFGRHIFSMLHLTDLGTGETQEIDPILILVAQMQRNFTPEELKQLPATLRKYPEQYQRLSNFIKQASKQISEFAQLL